MSMKNKFIKVLGISSLVGILSLSSFCRADAERRLLDKSPRYSQPKLEHISGTIIDIDEDCFGIHTFTTSGGGKGGANFCYEILYIEIGKGITKKILIPQPTEFRVKDKFDENYLVESKIYFQEILSRYADGAMYSMQKGYLKIDGILERE